MANLPPRSSLRAVLIAATVGALFSFSSLQRGAVRARAPGGVRVRAPFCDAARRALCLSPTGAPVNVSVPDWAGGAPAARAAPAAAAPPAHTLSQWGEDVFLQREFFFELRGGVILESGALDGLVFSNSHMLEAAFGWRAVLVEGSPRAFRALVANRPRALCIHAALCSAPRDVHYIDPGLAAGTADGAASDTAVSGLFELMSPALRAAWWPGAERDGTLARLPVVPCRSLTALLGAFDIAHVDAWVLDVEGAELSVLASLDLAAVRVDVILVELDGSAPEKDDAVRERLRGAGYVFDRRGHNHPAPDPYSTPVIDSRSEAWLRVDFERCARRFNGAGDGCARMRARSGGADVATR